MTYEEAKEYIINRIAEMQDATTGIAQTKEYQIGYTRGLLKAFRMTGVMTEEQRKALDNELVWEIMTA